MAVLLSSPMAPSILLRSPQNPSPSPSPTSTPLPALTADLSSSSSSSTSGSCLDLHRTSSLPSTRKIRFAPLPDPRRDELFDQIYVDDAQPTSKPTQETPLPPLPDGSVVLSPSISPDSSNSSTQSTPTIRVSQGKSLQDRPAKPTSLLLRPFSFLRRIHTSSPTQSSFSQSASLPSSRNASVSSFNRATSSAPNSPFSQPSKLSRISTEDILTFGSKSLFRSRSGSGSGNRPRPPSPPPNKLPDPNKSLQRAATTGSGAGLNLGHGKRDWGDGSPSQDSNTAGSGTRPRRTSSSSLTPGAGGGRHTSSTKMLSAEPRRPSTSPGLGTPKKHVKMLNGRIYGSKRYTTQTLANPFANVRDEPEFVEWGYGGMGSVHASAGIANDMWKGLQRSERGGALLAGTSFGASSAAPHATPPVAGGGGGRGHPHTPAVSRKMSQDTPECGMGSVGAGAGADDDDGSGMCWVKRRRAEREEKARLEQAAKELEQKEKEGRKSGDSMNAGMTPSIISTTASLTASTSVTTTDVTTPATSPVCSRSTSATDLNSKSSPLFESQLVPVAPQFPPSRAPVVASHSSPSQLSPTTNDDHEHHVLTAVRLSPKLSHRNTHSHGRVPSLSHSWKVGESNDKGETAKESSSSPVGREEMPASTSSSGDDEERLERDSDEDHDQEQEQNDDEEDEDDEDGAQEIARKTALGAGVEKISRHIDVEAR